MCVCCEVNRVKYGKSGPHCWGRGGSTQFAQQLESAVTAPPLLAVSFGAIREAINWRIQSAFPAVLNIDSPTILPGNADPSSADVGLELTKFASQFVSENQSVANQINILVTIICESTLYIDVATYDELTLSYFLT